MKTFIISLLVLLLSGAAAYAQPNRVDDGSRTLRQMVIDESAQRNRDITNPYDQSGHARNGTITTVTQRGNSKSAKEAFRELILGTLKRQDLSVSRVIDGDTIELSGNGRTAIFHLAGVDAPEIGQPGAQDSKAILEKMLAGKTVTIEYSTFCPKNRDGIFLGKVVVDGEDAGAYLLKNGWAWYDDAYSVFFDKDANKQNIEMAKAARAAKIGIWPVADVEPWKYAAKNSKKNP
jgi:micrococcal nuclease